MKFLLKFACFAALCAPLFAQATGNTTIQPDCLIPFTFAAAGNFPTTPVANASNDNRTKGCAAWTLMYQSTGLTGVTVTLQSGSSPTTTVSFGTFAGDIPTMPSGNANPIVSDTGGELSAINGTAAISWVRVNVAATGSGTLTGVLYGFRNSSAAVNGGGGGGGGTCPQGPSGSVQYSDGTDCQGSANFVWNNADNTLNIERTAMQTTDLLDFLDSDGTTVLSHFLPDASLYLIGNPIAPFQGLYVGPNESTLDPYFQQWISSPSSLFVSATTVGNNPASGLAVETQSDAIELAGFYSAALMKNAVSPIVAVAGDFDVLLDGSFNLDRASGVATFFDLTNYSGTLGLLAHFHTFPIAGLGTATVTQEAGIYIPSLGGAGVATATGVLVLDQVGATSNYAIKTGLGTNQLGDQLYLARDMALPFLNTETTASAVAPGANKADMRWLAGTVPGTCKLVANAGTSATEVTIIDNIGSGGC